MARNHDVSGANKKEKPVEVDQNALIHKILARYPSKFSLFRELLQNSDDAKSSGVQIYFETAATLWDPPLPPHFKPSDIVQLTFKNNGNEFMPEDWARLSKIAMDNTNSTKVGAFGVGFYSLFSVTNHPTVMSGGTQMEFYFKDDLLYFRKTQLESKGESSPGTTIKIPLHKPGMVPEKSDFMWFLATSITFMAHLEVVEVFLDRDRLGCINRTPGLTDTIHPPISLLHSTPLGMMNVYRLRCRRFTVEAKISTRVGEMTSTEAPKSSASQTKLESDTRCATPTIDNFYSMKVELTLFDAEVHVKVDEKTSEGLLRSMSKWPLSQFNYSLVYTGKDEYDQSLLDQERRNHSYTSVFRGLCADLDGASHPRIFIGHSTSQTTGIGGHMAAPFIPTVERESIDFVNASVTLWNSELLYIGGFLARVIYELELDFIKNHLKDATTPDQLHDYFIHVLKFFTFYDSRPSSRVSQEMRQSFYGCSTSPLRLLTSVGVRDATETRSFDPHRSKFLKSVPMLLPEVTDVAQRITNALPKEHRIGGITVEDMVRDLDGRSLDEAELLAYLEWQISHVSDMSKLLKFIRFRSPDGATVQLSAMTRCMDPKGPGAQIPVDGPMPPFVIPLRIAKRFDLGQLKSLGWKEFTIADWLLYISSREIRSANPKYDLFQSVDWAESVLHIVSLAWSSSKELRNLAKVIFANKKCIPVKDRLHSPTDTYLPDRNILGSDALDLLLAVQFPSGRKISQEMRCLLLDLGVRRHHVHVLILEKMVRARTNQSRLIGYLVGVADTLSSEEFDELKSCKIFARAGNNSSERFHAEELYQPTSTFENMRLRLIDWDGMPEWVDESLEAKLMYRLGLRRHPPMEDIIDLCSNLDIDIRKCAFDYLCGNLQTVYSGYRPEVFRDIAFVPARKMSDDCLEKLGDVFLDGKWAMFGLSVVKCSESEDIYEVLGVQRHPPPLLLLQQLEEKPPHTEEIARQWFEILSDYVECFKEDELKKLSRLKIVPKIVSGQEQEWLAPIQCYLQKGTKHELYSKLFYFVDFGDRASQFLRDCGAKNVPSYADIAEYLVNNHNKFYKVAGNERFMQELHDLATNHTRIPSTIIARMMRNPILPATKRERAKDSDSWKRVYSLWKPKDILIVNDIHAYRVFSDMIVVAPENMSPKLEGLYKSLGCKYLTEIVHEECSPSEEKADQEMCSKYGDLIRQRLRLFLRYHERQAGTRNPLFHVGIDVRVCERLSVSRTLLARTKSITNEQEVWAAAEKVQDTNHVIKVWISRSAKEDMYELAVSLCRALFNAVKLNDALLLMSMLSERDPDVLRRRGYEVDEVLQSPQRNDSGLACEPNTPSLMSVCNEAVRNGDKKSGLAPSPLKSFPLSKVMDRFHNGYSRVTHIISGSSASDSAQQPGLEHAVTPQSYIGSTVRKAIHASESRPSDSMDMVRFELDDEYCNVSSRIETLRSLGRTGGFQILVSQGISNVSSLMEDRQDQINHFAHILTDLAKIYGLGVDSLRIFYGITTRCIAFNHKKIIYLNLRYFEDCHYQDVRNGHPHQALSSWFLTLAHQFAHNIVASHNSKHEFWSSAICEAHLGAFSRFLGSVGSGTVGKGETILE